MYFPDLCTMCQVDRGEHVRAIGWLGNSHEYPVGPVRVEVISALRAHIRSAVQPVMAMGSHACEFCAQADDGPKRVAGHRNVWILTDDRIYVAPELVVHYIEVHNYCPPEEFIAAVLACPEQGSKEYLAMLSRFPSWQERMKSSDSESPA